MPRQTISFSEPNHLWLQQRVKSGEFKTQTEAVNDAIRRAREIESGIEIIRQKLIQAEESGLSEMTAEQILKVAKSSANG